jgi:outer membrane protein OmpA-like peptidoglycan-associated protein
LADSYYFTADYENAAKWYGALYEFSKDISADYLFRYAQTLKSTMQYKASDKIMEQLYSSKGGADFRSKLFDGERNYLAEIEKQSGRYEIEIAPFNSSLSDFAPTFYIGGIVFSSNRTNGMKPSRVHDWNDQPFLDIYKINLTNSKVEKFDKEINTKFHESTTIFTKDGQTVYFTRNNYTDGKYKNDAEGTNRLKLYRAKRTKKRWEVTELPFNSDEYSVSHPALSKDEKTLYFASDRPGGKGFSDLYKIAIEGDGFGEPVSLGDGINTEGRETFPFVSSDDKLYFASDGHIGLGGLDVFVTDIKEDGSFGDIYNVGRPINSPQDDFTFIINGVTGQGYFASNRDGGVGDDDIYSLQQITPLECRQTLKGQVLAEADNMPIAGAKVLLLDENNDKVAEAISDIKGMVSFDLYCSKQYSLRATKESYTTAEKGFVTNDEMGKVVEKTLFMEKGYDLSSGPVKIGDDLFKVLGLTIIYFDLDKSDIRPDAAIELQKIIAVMQAHPSMKIDVRSHTDSRASDSYNLALSERRAQATVDYIIKKGGITRSRLTGKGYGETRLVNECSNDVPCTEAQHQMNRRSEFIITE